MAGWNHDKAAWQPRYCSTCGTKFTPFSGSHKFCSIQCRGKWKYITGSGSTENQYKKISGNWQKYFQRLCNRTDRQDLSCEDCLDILEKQDYKCALSGVPLTCRLEKGIVSKTNASLDRIEAGGPYIKSNIQIVCRALNSWRTDTNLEEFKWWCSQVHKWHERKE